MSKEMIKVERDLIDDVQFTLRVLYRVIDDSNSNKKPINSKELKEIRELITRQYDRLEKIWKHEMSKDPTQQIIDQIKKLKLDHQYELVMKWISQYEPSEEFTDWLNDDQQDEPFLVLVKKGSSYRPLQQGVDY